MQPGEECQAKMNAGAEILYGPLIKCTIHLTTPAPSASERRESKERDNFLRLPSPSQVGMGQRLACTPTGCSKQDRFTFEDELEQTGQHWSVVSRMSWREKPSLCSSLHAGGTILFAQTLPHVQGET